MWSGFSMLANVISYFTIRVSCELQSVVSVAILDLVISSMQLSLKVQRSAASKFQSTGAMRSVVTGSKRVVKESEHKATAVIATIAL